MPTTQSQNTFRFVLLIVFCSATITFVLYLSHRVNIGSSAHTLSKAAIKDAEACAFDGESEHAPGPAVNVDLPHLWTSLSDGDNSVCYVLELNLAASFVADESAWAILIPNLEMEASVSINGRRTGDESNHRDQTQIDSGGVPPLLARYFNRPLLYPIASNLLLAGRNEIHIRLTAYDGRSGRLSLVYAGPRESLLPTYQRLHTLRVSYLTATALFSVILAIFSAFIAWIRRQAIYFWFAVFAISWGLLLVYIYIVRVPVPAVVWHIFSLYPPGLLLASGSLFILRLLNTRNRFWERSTIVFATVAPLLLAPLAVVNFELFDQAVRFVWLGPIVLCCIYPLVLLLRAVIGEYNLEKVILGVCCALAIIFGVHDWLFLNRIAFSHDGLWIQYSALPTLLALSGFLIRRFILALNEAETLNRKLEYRVQEKTIEIQKTMELVKQKEISEKITEERHRITRDIHDGVGGSLIGAINRVKRIYPDDSELADELDNALRDLRLIIDSDDVDNNLNVVLALFRNRIQSRLDSADIEIRWQVDDIPPITQLGPERALHILRILQEIVTNTIKHSAATVIGFQTRVTGAVETQDQIAWIIVSDNGVGYDTQQTTGRGLVNIRFRGQQANLILEMNSPVANSTNANSLAADSVLDSQKAESARGGSSIRIGIAV